MRACEWALVAVSVLYLGIGALWAVWLVVSETMEERWERVVGVPLVLLGWPAFVVMMAVDDLTRTRARKRRGL